MVKVSTNILGTKEKGGKKWITLAGKSVKQT